MPKITLMCGLPRSGKSTWITKKNNNSIIVSADDLRKLVYGQRFWKDGEPLMWSIRTILLKSLMNQKTDIIIDETNTTIQRRKPIIDIAKEYNYTIIIVVFSIDKDLCIKRAKNTNREDIIPIIEDMFNKFEYPNIDEGFDKIINANEEIYID